MTPEQIKKTKAFQDWMDINHPNWVGCTDSKCTNGKNLNKGKSYGTFGPSTTKVWNLYGNDFNAQYNPQSDGGAAQQSETVDKAKEIFDIYSKKIWFYNKNNVIFNLQEFNKEIGDWINYFISEGFNQPSAFLGAILMNYGTQLTQYKARKNVQDEIDKYLTALQDTLTARLNEGFKLKKLLGLSQILEQVSDFVVFNIVNGVPKKPTDDDNYTGMSSVTIKSIIGGGTELKKGDKSDTVESIKKTLGYDKDTTPYFTQDFDTFVINYKGTNGMVNSNGNIDQELICSIEEYKQLCSTSSGQKTTAPPTNTTDSTPIELKYLNDYATYVGTGIPSYGNCKSLFDYYSEQALNYRRLKKVKKKPLPTDTEEIAKEKLEKDKLMELLKPIKDKILYCQKSSDLKDRAKLDTLISQRFRIQQDKDSPYYLDI
jgi:hypothetical protein